MTSCVATAATTTPAESARQARGYTLYKLACLRRAQCAAARRANRRAQTTTPRAVSPLARHAATITEWPDDPCDESGDDDDNENESYDRVGALPQRPLSPPRALSPLPRRVKWHINAALFMMEAMSDGDAARMFH